MRRRTQAAIAGIVIIALLVFIIWQWSIEITFAHLFFGGIVTLFVGGTYYYLESEKERKAVQSKTEGAISYCKRWWYQEFGEHIDLREGQMQSARFSDYSNELFKSFIFQITSGHRKGRNIKIVYSFADNDIFEFNDSVSVSEIVSPFTVTKPHRISERGYYPREEEKPSPQQAVGIPFVPLEQPREESGFSQEGEENGQPVVKPRKRYY